MATNCYSSF